MARWLDKLLGRARFVRDWDELEVGPVELEGIVRPLEVLRDPVDDSRCVAIEYRAWPPSTTVGVDGSSVVGARAFQVVVAQAVEFLLEQGGRSLLVRPSNGEDVASRHEALQQQYGIGLRTEVHCVRPGDRVRVRGRVVHVTPAGGNPLRVDPYRAVVEAERMRIT